MVLFGGIPPTLATLPRWSDDKKTRRSFSYLIPSQKTPFSQKPIRLKIIFVVFQSSRPQMNTNNLKDSENFCEIGSKRIDGGIVSSYTPTVCCKALPKSAILE